MISRLFVRDIPVTFVGDRIQNQISEGWIKYRTRSSIYSFELWPCEKLVDELPAPLVASWFDVLHAERRERKRKAKHKRRGNCNFSQAIGLMAKPLHIEDSVTQELAHDGPVQRV